MCKNIKKRIINSVQDEIECQKIYNEISIKISNDLNNIIDSELSITPKSFD